MDDRWGFIDELNVAGADDQAAAGGEKADDGVVALMTENVAQFAAGAGRLSVGIRDFKECELASIDTGPAGVIQSFAVKVGAGGAVNCFRVGKVVEDGDGVTDQTFNHFVVDGVAEVEDRGVYVLFDGAHLAFGQAFVASWSCEVDAEGVLRPELSGATDKSGFLVPGEDLRGGAIAAPDVEAVPHRTGDLHDAFVA